MRRGSGRPSVPASSWLYGGDGEGLRLGPARWARAGAGHLHDLGHGAVRPLGQELQAGQAARRDHLGHGPQAAAAQLSSQRRTWRAGGAF